MLVRQMASGKRMFLSWMQRLDSIRELNKEEERLHLGDQSDLDMVIFTDDHVSKNVQIN